MTLLLCLFACTNSGNLVLDAGAGGDDGADIDDTGGGEEPTAHAAAGSYTGTVAAEVPEWDWELCDGDVEVEIDDDGALSGSGLCVAESNWGSTESEVSLEGAVDDDGEVSGEVVYEMWNRDGAEEYEAELSGKAEDGDLELEWDDIVEYGGSGWSEEVELRGTVEAELD